MFSTRKLLTRLVPVAATMLLLPITAVTVTAAQAAMSSTSQIQHGTSTHVSEAGKKVP